MTTVGAGAQAARTTLGELIRALEESQPRLDTSASRELLEGDDLAIVVDDLAYELSKAAPLHRGLVLALHRLAIELGASAEAIAALAEVAVRPSVLAIQPRRHEGLGGSREYRELTVDGLPIGDLALFHHDDAARQHAKLDELEGRPPGADAGRALIDRCTYCGDPECGTNACAIEVGHDVVRWHDFTSGELVVEDVRHPLGPFSFDRAAYLAVLNELRAGIPG